MTISGIFATLTTYAGQNSDAAGRTPWTLTSNLVHPRHSFQATTLLDGRVLVEGGVGMNAMKTSELFDPVSKAWTLSGRLGQGRWQHTATLLADGRVLVAGGLGGASSSALASAEVYDPSNATWTATGNLVTARQPFCHPPRGR